MDWHNIVSPQNMKMKFLYLILVALLLLLLVSMPYDYYQIVRFIAMVLFAFFDYKTIGLRILSNWRLLLVL